MTHDELAAENPGYVTPDELVLLDLYPADEAARTALETRLEDTHHALWCRGEDAAHLERIETAIRIVQYAPRPSLQEPEPAGYDFEHYDGPELMTFKIRAEEDSR